jgi:hypothetical protein
VTNDKYIDLGCGEFLDPLETSVGVNTTRQQEIGDITPLIRKERQKRRRTTKRQNQKFNP